MITAITVAMGKKSSGSRQAEAAAVLADCLRLAASAQTYCAISRALGGGGASFDGITFAKCGWRSQENENGTYFFLRIRNNHFQVRGYGSGNVAVSVPVYPDSVGTPTILMDGISYP